MKKYDTNSIKKLDHVSHIRKKSSMYIGDAETPTKLLVECIDNALDEVQAGYAKTILVYIDNSKNIYSIVDDGRGIPFSFDNPIESDPPVMISMEGLTSGKFDKGDDNIYELAIGTHGVGNTVVYSLSDYMEYSIYRDKEHACYRLDYDGKVKREKQEFKGKKPYSTKVTFKPCKKFFKNLNVDINTIRERLCIASCNFKNCEFYLSLQGNVEKINFVESDIVENYLEFDISQMIDIFITSKNKKSKESCHILFGWDWKNDINRTKTFSSVNLVPTEDGSHINKIFNIFKDYFVKQGKKEGIEFTSSEVLQYLRIYINLKIVEAHFQSQTKERLSKNSNIDILNELEVVLQDYFKKNRELLISILKSFELVHKTSQNKKFQKKPSKKRSSTGLTRLKDCLQSGGELLIGEGDSAMKGVALVRDPNKHAVLPLKGKILNVEKKSFLDLVKNEEMKDIINSLGCGVEPNCDIDKLRYNKIIIAADADPDGMHICALLITLFIKLFPKIIQSGRLFVCESPLYGVGSDKDFVPIWTKEELDYYRNNNYHIDRFKGLGEMSNKKLFSCLLDPKKRKLIKIEWSDKNTIERILFLMSKSAEERKNLVLGKFKI